MLVPELTPEELAPWWLHFPCPEHPLPLAALAGSWCLQRQEAQPLLRAAGMAGAAPRGEGVLSIIPLAAPT